MPHKVRASESQTRNTLFKSPCNSLDEADMQPWEKNSKVFFRVCICFGQLLQLQDAFEREKSQQEEPQQDCTLQNLQLKRISAAGFKRNEELAPPNKRKERSKVSYSPNQET